ncbi:hypothetical protein BASA81_007084 [Batrachochytrium salamandrivorans]|nr:hypothetical protein BASA81_007084 [Batrachochytrium salamandrivorans]
MLRADFAVVGGGVLGLITAKALAKQHPSMRICVLEKNSKLIPMINGNIRAQLLGEDRYAMVKYCYYASQPATVAPELACLGALFSNTMVNGPGFMESLETENKELGVVFSYDSKLTRITKPSFTEEDGDFILSVKHVPTNKITKMQTKWLINCGGLGALKVPTVAATIKKPTVKGAKVETLQTTTTPKFIPIDKYYNGPTGGTVFEDYDAMLNQTELGQNNNKFYKLQIIQYSPPSYVLFTRWGRVGEMGTSSKTVNALPEPLVKAFKTKFRTKTDNAWTDRVNFVKQEGKYQLLEMDYSADEPKPGNAAQVNTVEIAPSKLDNVTQWLIKLIFSKKMFAESMAHLKVDTSRLPLGALSKQQIRDGNQVLEEMMNEINTDKFDLLAVLSDIETATEMRNEMEAKKEEKVLIKPDPMDELYDMLDAQLEYIPATEEDGEFARLAKYAAVTGQKKLLHVWRMSRKREEGQEFHDKLTNRKLLWHGTNAAVVAAILKSGLRIMPNSGGRVGRGIYLASEHGKSASYVWAARDGRQHVGLMFLVEAALGVEHHITSDNSSLKCAPYGFNCIVAQGRQDPDPSLDVSVDICGRKVIIPQGEPISRSNYSNSSFYNSEFLLYNESQHKIRYVLAFDW